MINTSSLHLGPFARFHNVFEQEPDNRPGDARYLSVGLAASFGSTRVSLPGDRDGDGVLDADDLCVDVPRGDTPDPARRGCLRPDRDGDGVLNSSDLCRTVPQGATPDPSRMGCPAPDRDRDYVINGDDRCPDEPGMPRPGTDRHGCPGEVVVQAGSIRITHPVFFATNEDTILPQSFAVLTAVRDTSGGSAGCAPRLGRRAHR